MSTQSKTFLTPEQYLEIERKAEFKSEYYQGEMFAMSGARLAHIQIVGNAMREFGQQLRERPCQPLSNGMRVCVSREGCLRISRYRSGLRLAPDAGQRI